MKYFYTGLWVCPILLRIDDGLWAPSLVYMMSRNDICGFDSLFFSIKKRETSSQKGVFLESDQGSLVRSHLTLLLEKTSVDSDAVGPLQATQQ